MPDIFGKALLDYFHGNYTEDILTETSISEEDVLPLPYLFRSYTEMPGLEQKALELAKGKVLDVGCGAGSHALFLQEKGLEVVAVDVSEGAVDVARLRGVKDARKLNLLDISNQKFDTILLLMNGTGIFQQLAKVSQYLQKLRSLLAPAGQILIDSSDLNYMYDGDVPSGRYYGEIDYKIKYKGEESEPFPLLYLDAALFERLCQENGLAFEIVYRGDHYDYLARLNSA